MTGAAEHPVPLGYEGMYVVRNGFIEAASGLLPPDPLGRSQTAPPRYANAGVLCSRPDELEWENCEGEHEQPVVEPVPGAAIERLRPRDVYDGPADLRLQQSCGDAVPASGPPREAAIQTIPASQPQVVQASALVLAHLPAELQPGPAHESQALQPGQGWCLLPLPQSGPLKPQSLQMSTCATTGQRRLEWLVDSRKLRGNDKQAVSPSFDIACDGTEMPFRLMLYPKRSFKSSGGRGSVTLKCEVDLAEGAAPLTYRSYIGSGAAALPSAPVTHDFSKSALSRLPSDVGELNFSAVVDEALSVFVVALEVHK